MVLTEAVITGESSLKTYYIYDEYGLLRYVLPPKLSETLPSGSNPATLSRSDDHVKKLGYYYLYDRYNRVVEKQLPGGGTIHLGMAYRDQ